LTNRQPQQAHRFARRRAVVRLAIRFARQGLSSDSSTTCPPPRSEPRKFDGTERDSVLGTYTITEEGETTLDAPLAAYGVEDGEVLPAR
jgi:hypothetical protein